MLGGFTVVKKAVLFIIFTVVFASCKNTEIVQNKNIDCIAVENELKIWNLSKASEMLSNLDEESKNKYSLFIEEKKAKLEELYKLEGIVKTAFYTGDFSALDNFMNLGAVDGYKYEKLKDFEISDVRVYIGKREFLDNNVDEIAIMNFFEENIYLELKLQYDGNGWFIKSFSEKR